MYANGRPPKIEISSLDFANSQACDAASTSHGLCELGVSIDFGAFRQKLQEPCRYGYKNQMFRTLVLQKFCNLDVEGTECQLKPQNAAH